MLKITESNKIDIELEDRVITLKPVPFSKYEELVKNFDKLLEAQLVVNFSIAHLLADKKNYQLASNLCKLFKIEGSEDCLNIEQLESNPDDLCNLLFGKAKEPYCDLASAFWAWLYPDNKKTIEYIQKFELLQQEEVVKQILQEAGTVDLIDLFEPPAIAKVHKLNWFTDLLGKAQQRVKKEAEEAKKQLEKLQDNSTLKV